MRERARFVGSIATIATVALIGAVVGGGTGSAAGSADPVLDTTWSGDGIATFNGAAGTSACEATTLSVGLDSSSIVQLCNAIVKIAPSGQLDPSFASAGKYVAPTEVRSAADDSGGILLARFDSSSSVLSVRRLTPGGVVDSSFAGGVNGGEQRIPVAGSSYPAFPAVGVAITMRGSTVAVATAPSAGPSTVVELTTSGAFVGGFGNNGVVQLSAGVSARNLVLRPDGKLLVDDGSTTWLLGTNGALDPAFGSGGALTAGSPFVRVVDAASGFVRVVTDLSSIGSGANATVERFDAAGHPVTSFGTNGSVLLPMARSATLDAATGDVIVATKPNQSEVRIVRLAASTGAVVADRTSTALGSTARLFDGPSGSRYLATGLTVVRLSADLGRDPAFNAPVYNAPGFLAATDALANGRVRVWQNTVGRDLEPDGSFLSPPATHSASVPVTVGTFDSVSQRFVDSQGRLLVVVSSMPSSATGFSETKRLVRFTPSGELDATFGSSGVVVLGYRSMIGLDSSDRIYLADPGSTVVRLGSTGIVDSSYGNFGGVFGVGRTVAPDGRVVLTDPMTPWILRMVDATGQPVTTFGTNGTTVVGAFSLTPVTVTLLSDGRWLACGERCARLTSTGQLDPTFSGDGVVDQMELWPGHDAKAMSTTLTDDGWILARVFDTTVQSAVRLISPAGVTTGASTQWTLSPFPGGGFLGVAAELTGTGPTGWTTRLHRVNSDGSPVSTFGVNGVVTRDDLFAPTLTSTGGRMILQSTGGLDYEVTATGSFRPLPGLRQGQVMAIGSKLYALSVVNRFEAGFDAASQDVQILRVELDGGATAPPVTPGSPPSTAPSGSGSGTGSGVALTPLAAPGRLLDTRRPGDPAGSTPLRGGDTLEVEVAGYLGVPGGATSVALNVTAVDPEADGYLTVWPCGSPMPTASNVNYRARQTTPNLVMVRLGTAGKVCVFSERTTGIIIDVSGFFDASSPYVGINPRRILETRASAGQVNYGGEKPVANAVVHVPVGGRDGVPIDAAGVVLNITGVDATEAGYVTVWPCDQPMPTASNLNLQARETRANLAVSKVAADGTVCLFTERGADLLVDLGGYFPAGSGFHAVNPQRLLETRAEAGQVGYTGPKPDAGAVVELALASAVPSSVTAVILNVTATGASADGYVTVWPCDQTMPTVSNLNLLADQSAPNLVVVRPGTNGRVCLFTERGTHLLVDLAGYFSAA